MTGQGTVRSRVAQEAAVAQQRTESEQQIAELLRTAKSSLQISVAFLSRLDGTTQHLEVVDSSIPLLFREGVTQKQETSLCQAVIDGDLPPVMADLEDYPAAMALPAARIPRIRSFVSVPVRLSDGSLYGTFCAAGLTSDPELGKRDQALMEVLASAASTILEPGLLERARAGEIEGRLWLFAILGTVIALLQLVVYSVIARQGQRSILLVWAGLAALVVGALFMHTITSLLLWVAAVDAVLLLALLTTSYRHVGQDEPLPATAP